MSENNLNQFSPLLWGLGILGIVVAGFISVSIVRIAKDARQGHDLAVKIENKQETFSNKQETFSTTLSEVRSKLEQQGESNYRLREQFLLLDQSTRSMSELVQQQNLILQGLGNLSYKVEVLENKEDVPPWITERLDQQKTALNDFHKQLEEMRQRVRRMAPQPPQME